MAHRRMGGGQCVVGCVLALGCVVVVSKRYVTTGSQGLYEQLNSVGCFTCKVQGARLNCIRMKKISHTRFKADPISGNSETPENMPTVLI